MPKKILLTRRHVLWLGLGTCASLIALHKAREVYHNLKILALDDPSRDFTVNKGGSLKERAAAKGIIYGAAGRYPDNALLVYNDFGLEYEDTNSDKKRAAVLKLLERLKSTGTPIHALGIQAHLFGSATSSYKKLRKFLSDVASLGLQIMITELDVIDEELPSDIPVRDRIIAKVYEDFLSVVLDEPAVKTIITWGLSDGYTYHTDFHPRSDGMQVRPLPLDTDLKPKLAWNAIARALDNAPNR